MGKSYIAYIALGVVAVVILASVLLGSKDSEAPKPPEGYIIPNREIHWHSTLKIYIHGQEQVIPPNIGIGRIHEPLHTHEADGVLHMENSNPSAKPESLTLGYLFKLWEKRFDSECIFDYCNGSDGRMKMYVNGVESHDFGGYYMSDGDLIEIHYA